MKVAEIKFDEHGLVPAIVQDARTRRVLMLAYMNRESLNRTLESGETWFWSRSRRQLWHKGETSGHTQTVAQVSFDCDADALLVLVRPKGPACHTGAESCFFNLLADQGTQSDQDLGVTLASLYELITTRKRERPADSYTSYLFDQGLDKILKKVGEEATETIVAAKNNEPESLVKEAADLLYHLCVLLVECGVTLDAIGNELIARRALPKKT
ncbi:MAG TPA: bifunctional phosphoribosyl-AMP cyclohydrolase/phosphoribosyl-ATP diphosphatase HisIE, partial [Pyrinomonadaceae bacterium]|nr:bifunctional phosphoribosyl-AMP cyclohydrolase/phosphoribosyl-ATP diphosphatase HisIE [Pyrinomonadaceae bacterium]